MALCLEIVNVQFFHPCILVGIKSHTLEFDLKFRGKQVIMFISEYMKYIKMI